MFYVNFWWEIVKEKCQRDCLVEKSNIIHTETEIENFLETLEWEQSNPQKARQVGNIAMNLNSLAYGLYTDIFAHNSMENFGAYDVSQFFSGKKHIMVIKQWANLRPKELYSEFADFRFDKLNIFTIYKDIDYTVDIYTHQVYSGNTATNLAQYSVLIDDKYFLNDTDKIEELNEYLSKIVVEHFQKIQKQGFEESKKIWVLSRNYQFKDFFQKIGLDWYDQEMLEKVKNKPLLKTDYWDFEKYPKEILFKFWKACFDPRLDTLLGAVDQEKSYFITHEANCVIFHVLAQRTPEEIHALFNQIEIPNETRSNIESKLQEAANFFDLFKLVKQTLTEHPIKGFHYKKP